MYRFVNPCGLSESRIWRLMMKRDQGKDVVAGPKLDSKKIHVSGGL